MDRIERKRIERRIAKADRRLARGIDLRQEKYLPVSEQRVKETLTAILGS